MTMDFANELVAQAMISKSSIGGTAVKMAEIMTLQGSQLTSLMPSGHSWWTSALAATFLSPASADILGELHGCLAVHIRISESKLLY